MGRTLVPNQSIDPETLAALLDGTLDAAERDRVLATLARSEEAYEDFLEARAVLSELADDAGGEHAPAGTVAPPTSGPSSAAPLAATPAAPAPQAPGSPRVAQPGARVHRWRRGGLAATVSLLAAAVIALTVLMRDGMPPDAARTLVTARQLTETVDRDGGMVGAFGAGWDRPSWSAVRGAEEGLSERARAFRSGVRLAQLELTLGVADTVGAATVAVPLARLVASVAGGAPMARRVEQVARLGASASPAMRDSLAFALRGATGMPLWFDLGVWSETARLAARGGHVAFFQPSEAPMAELRRLLEEADRLTADERRDGAPLLRQLEALADRTIAAPSELRTSAALLDSAVAAGGR